MEQVWEWSGVSVRTMSHEHERNESEWSKCGNGGVSV